MTHPLDGAYVRLDRAGKHLAELKETIGRFFDDEHEIAAQSVHFNPKPGPPVIYTRPESPIPQIVPVLVGEIVYHLRAALDYIVYELAILDSGSIQNGAQFPIESAPQGFQGRVKTYLRGINNTHAASIKALQPYNGVNWTKTLQSISNPDKHRHLINQRHQSVINETLSKNPTDTPDLPGVLYIRADADLPDGGRMYMKLGVTLFISFDDGLPVIETLEKIKLEVANTLANFQPEF